MDRYSKIVLTVIAVALTVLVAQNGGILPANAQSTVQKVAICNPAGTECSLVAAQRLYVSEH